MTPDDLRALRQRLETLLPYYDDALAALAALAQEREQSRVRAYRQARIFEPSMEAYHAAMAVYAAAFGKPDGEPTVLIPDGSEKQPWELAAARPAPLAGLVEQWRYEAGELRTGDYQIDMRLAGVFNQCADELEAALRSARGGDGQ